MILVTARCVHYCSASILFGASAYGVYAARRASLDRWLIPLAAVFALVSGVAWLGCEASALSGDSRGAFDPAILRAVLTQTEFGRLWTVRLILAFAIVAVVLVARNVHERFSALIVVASGLLLVSLSGTGHAASEDALHRTADIVHLSAAGIWLGGLCALGLRASFARPALERSETRRFSNVALAAVALLVATGIANSAFLFDWGLALNVAYGRVLLTKVALVVCMIAAAAVSRRHVRDDGRIHVLRRSLLLEQGCGALVLVATSVLGTLSPNGM